MRYTSAIAISLGLYATWHRQNGDCVAYTEVATLLVQLSVSAVLGWRTIAIWQKDTRILVIIFLLLSTLMIFSSLLVLSMKPQKLRNGACVLVEDGNYAFFPLAWFYAGTVLYDTLVIVLSTYRLWQHHNDVGVFPGANPNDTSKGDIGWTRWIHSQWNSITPLLFRMTSNGVLYLAFSTVFNVVCFIVGHCNEDHAQDLMLLYSSVMWVVAQHMVLLEIRAAWGDKLATDRSKDATTDEADRLIAEILQASWSFKPPPPSSSQAGDIPVENKDPELVLSLSVDSCLKRAPGSCCRGDGSGARPQCSQPPDVRDKSRMSLKTVDDEVLGESSVQQLHDFRPCIPGESFDGFGARSLAASDRAELTEGNTSSSVLITRTNENSVDDKKGGIRQRLGALCHTNSPNKILAHLTKSSRGDAASDSAKPSTVVEIDHPLKDSPALSDGAQQIDSTPSRFLRISQVLEQVPKASTSASPELTTTMCACNCNRHRRANATDSEARSRGLMQAHRSTVPRVATSTIEVADMLANMTDDAKTTALALAGMEGVAVMPSCSMPSGSSLAAPRVESKRSTWNLHPPL